MAIAEIEKKDITGLDSASNKKEAEYDLLTALLEAADYKNADDEITEVDIKRNGKFLFSVHVRALSEEDNRFARKKATTYMPNPNGAKLPAIEKDFDNVKFKSWLIYLATTPEDQNNIWGNPTIMQKFGLKYPYESIDKLLKAGEKSRLMDLIYNISGYEEDEAGNVVAVDQEDEVSFQQAAD